MGTNGCECADRTQVDLVNLTRGMLDAEASMQCMCRSRFKCAALKLAMIKNQHLAESLFKGNVYDCVCLYEPPPHS